MVPVCQFSQKFPASWVGYNLPHLVCWLGSAPHLMGRIGSGVWISVSFKNCRLVGRLGSEPRLVADRTDVVFTQTLQLCLIGNT